MQLNLALKLKKTISNTTAPTAPKINIQSKVEMGALFAGTDESIVFAKASMFAVFSALESMLNPDFLILSWPSTVK